MKTFIYGAVSSLVIFLSICLFGWSRHHNLPDLCQWFNQDDSSLEMVHVDGKLFASLLKNEGGNVDKIFLTDGGDLILSIEFYGNGRAINIASSGRPGLLVHQGSSGIDVSRYIRLHDGTMKQIVYGVDGHIAEERQIPDGK